jgi:hypothetical protein
MARVKRGVAAKRRHKKVLEQAKGYYGKEPLVQGGQRAGPSQRAVRLPRPPGEEGRIPPSLDPADQRRLPAERHELQPLHRRPQRGRYRGRSQGAR